MFTNILINRFFIMFIKFFCWLAVFLLVAVIFLFVGFLIQNGLHTLNLQLFFGNQLSWSAISGKIPVLNGIWPALLGTGYLVCLTISLAILPGIGCGIYLAEYAKGHKKTLAISVINILAGTPSIVMGLIGFIIILFLRKTFYPHANTSLILAAICLALLVLPIIIITTKESLESLPKQLRITSLSLGMNRGQYVKQLLLPSASKGIFAGIILATGRSAEDTAVIMLTGAVANSGLPAGLGQKFEALSFHIYLTAAEYQTEFELIQGFSTALVLLFFSMSIMFLATQLQRKYKKHHLG